MNTLTEAGLGTARLRVLMVTPFHGDGGGVGSVAKELTDKLLEQDIEVDVLHWWPNFSDPAMICTQRGRIALASLADFLAFERNYDVLHFQSAAYSDRINGGLSRILQRHPAPIVYTIHSLAAYHGEIMNNVDDMRVNVRDQSELMEKSARVILLTDDLIDIAVRHHPDHAARFCVTPNGTNLPQDSAALQAELTRLQDLYNPDQQARILLYVGRISTEKGIYELIDAFPAIKRAHPACKLLIAGNKANDPNVEKIRQSLIANGLLEQRDFDFAGWVDGVTKSALYELAEFVIMPSYYEHMPLTALEAMARRKPVLISDIASLRLTFGMDTPDQCCVLPIKKIKDAQAVADAVAHAFTHPAQVAQVVARAYAKVQQRYNWDAVVRSWITLYQQQLPPQRAAELQWLAEERQRAAEQKHQQQQSAATRLVQQAKRASTRGKHADAFALLQQAKALAPDLPALSGALAAVCQSELETLRAALAADLCEPQKMARMQLVAETLRQAKLDPLRLDPARRMPEAEVTVLMPVFLRREPSDGLRFLREAIDSVMQQSFSRPYQLIIIDDRSEIDVAAFIGRHYPDLLLEIRHENGELRYQRAPDALMQRKWIKLIQKSENSGNDVAPRNVGILDALLGGCPYLTQCDSDDRRPPGFLQTSYDYLESHPDTDFLHGRHRCIDEHGALHTGGVIDGWYNYARRFTFGMDQHDPANQGRSKRNTRAEIELLAREKDNWVHGGSIMYRSNVVWRVGLENLKPTKRYGADHVFWQNISRVATMDYLSTVLTEHRLHGGSMTQGGR
jgi:glycosyltransferase involved in cell wall biosynthesis/GT2 family glycosyltransferase